MNQQSRYGLNENTISSLKSVFAQYSEIEKVILYGSRAKGNYKPGSDIDLVLIAPKMNLTQLMMIEEQIDGLNLPYKIDLSLIHQIENDELIAHIQRVGVDF